MLHGVERYSIDGEGVIEGSLVPSDAGNTRPAGAVRGDPFMTPEKRLLTSRKLFCRMFEEGTQPDANALISLGLAMESEVPGGAGGDSSTAAGYTYFGQFLDHDINFDRTPLALSGAVDPTTTENNRTPSLDLDSVYGGGPSVRPDLYEADGASLRIGICSPSQDASGVEIPASPNDLVRVDRRAVIGDPRNDENLALAQLHLAFLKFHNTFVDEFRSAFPSLGGERLFHRAREATIKHYQRIVLRDFLPKIIDLNAVEFILGNGHRFFPPEKHDLMPIEFSVAAFRLGHSMIRPRYEWNRVFNSQPGALAPATLELLFEFTHFSGSTVPGDQPFFGQPTLPSNWAVDWRLMFDIDGNPAPQGLDTNRARRLDTRLAFALSKLPEFAGAGETQKALLSLAARNLLRGRLVKLPHGLAVADAIAAGGLPHDKLSEAQLRGGPTGQTLADVGLLHEPPLWYYILREGELRDGETLGPVGSAIIAETIIAHIRNSDVSVLADPSINNVFDVEPYTMSQMLNRIGDLNPVG
jgi:hypothetical protein